MLNNVETYANVPKIILEGADWFRTIGTEGSPGTKTFSLTGAIENTGLIEVPMEQHFVILFMISAADSRVVLLSRAYRSADRPADV